jgi:hypothetical protein
VYFDYAWSHGEAYSIRLFTTNAIPFDVDIPVAFETPEADQRTFLNFTLIGLYVGVIPVYLGLFWFPALRQLSRHVAGLSVGYHGRTAGFPGGGHLTEALEQSSLVPGPFQAVGLID